MEIYQNLSLENLPSEEWRDIVGYEGSYLISNYGRVKSLPKKATVRIKSCSTRTTKEKIIKQLVIKGYCKIGLTKNKKQKSFFVHRLVTTAFLDNPENKLQVNHIDCVKYNNHLSNLEWATQMENHLHAVSMGKCQAKKIKIPKYFLRHNPHTSKKMYKYRLDGTLVAWYNSFGEAARQNNVKSNMLSRIVKSKKHHSHKGFYYLDFPLITFNKEEKINRIRAKISSNLPTID